jgi:D-alanyl-D-alanine carboxypeptidase-like protein
MRPFLCAALALTIAASGCAASAPAASSVSPSTASTGANSTPEAETPVAVPKQELTADGAAGAAPVPSAPPLEASATDGGDASVPPRSSTSAACNEQAPQDFLVRSNFLKGGRDALARAIQYRTDTYGYFKGFGDAGPDAQPPSAYLVSTTFRGLPIKMHRKVVPALRCVEEEIERSCADHPYKPQALAGIRFRNTYRGGEVTNHLFGIAIDIDPARNSCCGCVKPWSDVPACTRPSKTEYDRMAMPECWVHAFERYGFYWLGHDRLRDTMHFEFLGDPDHILKGD